jgi:hypothetical protein
LRTYASWVGFRRPFTSAAPAAFALLFSAFASASRFAVNSAGEAP